MNWTQESLRALSGLILLILALASLWKTNTPNFFDYVIIGLMSFLAGGSLLTKNKE